MGLYRVLIDAFRIPSCGILNQDICYLFYVRPKGLPLVFSTPNVEPLITRYHVDQLAFKELG